MSQFAALKRRKNKNGNWRCLWATKQSTKSQVQEEKISKGELNGSNNLTKIDGRQLLKKQNHDEFVETVNKTQERHKLRTVE